MNKDQITTSKRLRSLPLLKGAYQYTTVKPNTVDIVNF